MKNMETRESNLSRPPKLRRFSMWNNYVDAHLLPVVGRRVEAGEGDHYHLAVMATSTPDSGWSFWSR